MWTVAGVDDGSIQMSCQKVWGPGVAWRTTTASTPMASIVLAVSINVSPLETLEPLAENSTVSAPKRFAASEKLFLVRVLFSKKRLATVRPFKRSSLTLPASVQLGAFPRDPKPA